MFDLKHFDSLWPENILCNIFNFEIHCLTVWYKILCIFVNILLILKKKVYAVVVWDSVLFMSLRSNWWITFFLALLIFFLFALSIAKKWN